MTTRTQTALLVLTILLILLLGAVFCWDNGETRPGKAGRSDPDLTGTAGPGTTDPGRGDQPARSTRASSSGEAAVLEAFDNRRSGLMLQAAGVVDRLLADDRDGSAHQRFILRLKGGHTLLISHNIDLADRVPLSPGDSVGFRGQYEWNDRGGVIHWTHHDPDGRRSGGWIRHQGETYR